MLIVLAAIVTGAICYRAGRKAERRRIMKAQRTVSTMLGADFRRTLEAR